MKFTVTNGHFQVLGTIDVTEEVYVDDDALIAVLAEAGYVDRDEVLDVTEDVDDRIDIVEYESGTHVVSLTLIH